MGLLTSHNLHFNSVKGQTKSRRELLTENLLPPITASGRRNNAAELCTTPVYLRSRDTEVWRKDMPNLFFCEFLATVANSINKGVEKI